MTMLGLDVLLAVANVVYLASYSVRDILWLRILAVLGGLLLLPYYFFQPATLWGPIGWGVVFLSINIFWIVKLFLERRPVQFTEEERDLYQLALRSLRPQDAKELFRLGTWSKAPEGTSLITQGKAVDALTLIVDGHVNVDLNGTQMDTLGKGRFLGATAFLSRGSKFAAPVTVTATEATRIITWSSDDLVRDFAKNSALEIAIEASLGLEVSRFLKTARSEVLQAHLS